MFKRLGLKDNCKNMYYAFITTCYRKINPNSVDYTIQNITKSVYKVWVKGLPKKQTYFKVNLKLVKYEDLKVEFDLIILMILYIVTYSKK